STLENLDQLAAKNKIFCRSTASISIQACQESLELIDGQILHEERSPLDSFRQTIDSQLFLAARLPISPHRRRRQSYGVAAFRPFQPLSAPSHGSCGCCRGVRHPVVTMEQQVERRKRQNAFLAYEHLAMTRLIR